MAQYDMTDAPRVSGWAIGGLTFAGTMLIMIGIFEAIDGLVVRTGSMGDEIARQAREDWERQRGRA